jgi:hypothetical protein
MKQDKVAANNKMLSGSKFKLAAAAGSVSVFRWGCTSSLGDGFSWVRAGIGVAGVSFIITV